VCVACGGGAACGRVRGVAVGPTVVRRLRVLLVASVCLIGAAWVCLKGGLR
jgi:hypothetical protein